MYFHELHCRNGTVLSVDKLVLEFEFFWDGENNSAKFLRLLQSRLTLDFDYWINTGMGGYRYQYRIKCDKGHTFWIGLAQNQVGRPLYKYCRLEFNPNKLALDDTFIWVFNRLCDLCKKPVIKRFDLACDYPVSRENAFLGKDGRRYQEVRNSWSDRTQYLGIHNSHGFIKLYNKQLESKLAMPLTRLELTLDKEKSTWADLQVIWPKVSVINDMQMTFDHQELTQTDRYILYTALDNYDMLNMLGYVKRKKIERILSEYAQTLEINEKDYNQIISTMDYFVKHIDVEFFKPETIFNPFTEEFQTLERG